MQATEQVVITGADLRLEREADGASIAQMARAWPCSATNIQLIEGAASVTPDRAARYRAALELVDVVEASRAVRVAAAALLALE